MKSFTRKNFNFYLVYSILFWKENLNFDLQNFFTIFFTCTEFYEKSITVKEKKRVFIKDLIEIYWLQVPRFFTYSSRLAVLVVKG